MDELLLRTAYTTNIVILTPVLISLFSHAGDGPLSVFEGKVGNQDGLRLLVGSLWAAILLCSLGGLYTPEFFIPILILQVIYKSLYLILFILPRARAQGPESIPLGITVSFIAIVIAYPIIFYSR
ncbi:MAG: hypothetical protein KC777_13800 [Cyanobacteria bacterium HKST-UBA02]|nr:hypothetical protein [Cyanobacteria bacterium HKST-UBA02]